MRNILDFEDYIKEFIESTPYVKDRLFESGDSFNKRVFDNTVNITGKNCVVINDTIFANTLAKRGNNVFCLYFDNTADTPVDSNVRYEYVKIISSTSSKKGVKESVTNEIREKFNEYRSKTPSYENGSVDVIFNFSIPTSSSFDYNKVTQVNLFMFDLFFEPGITVWYSFDEYDVLTEFQKMKSSRNFKLKINIIGRKIDNETWRDLFGFNDDTERYFTKFFITDDELLKVSKYTGEEFDEEDMSGGSPFGAGFIKAVSEPRIYSFRSDYVDNVLPEDTTAIKVGDTNRDVMQRMNEWGKVFDDIEYLDDFSAVLSGCGEGIDGKIIRDYAVHKVLEESGKERMEEHEFGADNIMNGRYSREFFKNTTTGDVKNAIDEIHRRAIEGRYDILSKLKDKKEGNEIRFIYPTHHNLRKLPVRDLQERTIDNFVKRFGYTNQMLMYAVMRFGKTYTACRCMDLWKGDFNVVVTGKVGVKNEWIGTINKSSQFFEYDAYTASNGEGGLKWMLENDHPTITVGRDSKGKEIKMRGPHPGKKFKTLEDYFKAKANEQVWWVVKGDDKTSDAYYETKEEAVENSEGREVEERLVKKKIVLFVSLQDLMGDLRKNKKKTMDDRVSFIKEKHACFYDYPIDMLIIDEAHFATQSKVLGETLKEREEEPHKYKREVEEEDKNLDDDDDMRSYEEKETSIAFAKTMNITKETCKLYLSGTPYNLIANGDFKDEDVISKFGFYELMKAKNEWDEKNAKKSEEWLRKNDEKRKNGEPYEDENRNPYRREKNPYFGIPKMISLGYKMDKFKLEQFCQDGEFKFKLFFEAKQDESKKWRFVNEETILKLFKVIDGAEHDGDLMTILDLPEFKKGNMLKNIVIVLPYRRCCDAFENMIIEHRDEFKHLGDYTIIKATSMTEIDPDFAKDEVLRNVERGNNTITLTVGRLMTGVTVAPWDTMFYMRDLKKPQEYDQAKFRIQSPYIKEVATIDIDKDGKVYNTEPTIIDMKPQTLFVDFSPRRMFDMTRERIFSHSGATGGIGETDDLYKMVEDTYNREENSLPIILMENGAYRVCDGLDVVKYINDNQEKISINRRFQKIKSYPKPSDMEIMIMSRVKPADSKNKSETKDVDAILGDADITKKEVDEELDSLRTDAEEGRPVKVSKRTVFHCSESEREKLEKNFFKQVETIMRDIFMFIILKNDDTNITNFHRLWDAMTHTNPEGINYELVKNIFLDDLGIEERPNLEETVRIIKDTLQVFIGSYLRRCQKLEDFTDMMIQTQKSFRKDRNNFENLKEQLAEFGQRIGETEIITNETIIPKLTEDFVIFNNEKILDCYGSKIGEILNHFATDDRFKDKFDIDNYYMVCRTPLIAELNKPAIKMLYGRKYPIKGSSSETRVENMFSKRALEETKKFMEKHILILDPTKEDYTYRTERKKDEIGKEYTIERKEIVKDGEYVVCLGEEIQRKFEGMKFDIVVGNPPYEYKGAGTLHLRIMNTVLKFCTDKLAFIMPSKPISQQLPENWFNMFKNAVCSKIEVVNKEVFSGTNMDKTAIYYCDRNEDPKNYCKKLDVDKIIYDALDYEGHRLFMDKLDGFGQIHILIGWDRRQTEKYPKRIKDGYYYLNVNRAGVKPGQGEIQWLSGTLKKMSVLSKDEELDDLLKKATDVSDGGHTTNVIECPNKEYGENLKNLMVDGFVLRYGLWLQQVNQNIYQSQFKYVPDIDYTNIHTDDELLAACGFTPEEIEKTMDYLRHFDFSQNRNEVVRNYTGYEVETDEDE